MTRGLLAEAGKKPSWKIENKNQMTLKPIACQPLTEEQVQAIISAFVSSLTGVLPPDTLALVKNSVASQIDSIMNAWGEAQSLSANESNNLQVHGSTEDIRRRMRSGGKGGASGESSSSLSPSAAGQREKRSGTKDRAGSKDERTGAKGRAGGKGNRRDGSKKPKSLEGYSSSDSQNSGLSTTFRARNKYGTKGKVTEEEGEAIVKKRLMLKQLDQMIKKLDGEDSDGSLKKYRSIYRLGK